MLDGDPPTQLPSPKGAHPQFSANVPCGETAGWTKIPLGMEVGLGPGDFVFDGDPAPSSRKRTQPATQFLAYVYCGQTAVWIKMALGTEVNLGPGDVVLDGDRASPTKGAQQLPLFSTHVYFGHGRQSQLLLSSCLVLSRMTGHRANSQMLESADFLASKS